MTKALIVYGTRYGATAESSRVIAETLRQEGVEVEIVDAKRNRVQDISDFDLVVVGSGIQMGKWTSEPQEFVKKYQKELSKKKVAIFVSCGSANPLSEGEQKTKEMNDAKQKYLEDKAAEFNLKPVAMGFFGGCYDFNKMSWFFKRTLSSIKPKLEEAGYSESKPGLYDLRDLKAVRSWSKEVAKLVKDQS